MGGVGKQKREERKNKYSAKNKKSDCVLTRLLEGIQHAPPNTQTVQLMHAGDTAKMATQKRKINSAPNTQHRECVQL